MSILAPFSPKYGSTVTVTAGAGAQDVNVDPYSKQLIITNFGTQLAFIRCKMAGDTTAATAADFPILPNSQTSITKSGNGPQNGHSVVSVVAPGGASEIMVTSGEGW